MRNIFIGLFLLTVMSCSITPMNQTHSVEQILIGGISQGIAVTGDPAKPALLMLHGGGLPLPGVASKDDYPVLSENFLVVYWDQRGTGLSANGNHNTDDMKIGNFLSDVQEITEYIKKTYDKEKLYLLGHSWGSMLGIRSVIEHPENYYAYIGVSQQLRVTLSDELVHEHLVTLATDQGDDSLRQKLEELGPPPYELDRWLQLRELAARNGGLVSGEGEMGLLGLLARMFGSFFGNPDYGMFEMFRVQRNMNSVMSYIYDDMLSYDMTEITSVEVPVVLFHGQHDLNSHPDIAHEWFDNLESSNKVWISFEKSAHMPMWEEPEKFQTELVRLLQFD